MDDDDGQPPNVQLTVEQVLEDINRAHGLEIEANLRPVLNAAEMLVPSDAYDGSFWSYLASQLVGNQPNLALTRDHTLILENPDLNNAEVAWKKFHVMSHVMFIKEISKFHQFTHHNIPVITVTRSAREYFMVVEDKTLEQGRRVVVCKTPELSTARDLSYYYGVVEGMGDGTMAVRCSHVDPMDDDPYFEENDRISVLFPPYDHLFEAHQRVVLALRYYEPFRQKFFPAPIDADLPDLPAADIGGARDVSQLTAIKGIVFQHPLRIYVLHGPPGTGKTWVVVLAVMAIVARALPKKTVCRILICGPSNAACDVLAKRFFRDPGIENNRVVRLFAPSLNPEEIDAEILQNAFIRESRFYLPHMQKEVDKFQVIICTLNIASRLSFLPRGYFDHIIIDEDGQCLEMDTMIPAALYANEKTRVAIVGDPKQLPPFFADGILGQERFHADATTIERLCAREEYTDDNGANPDPRLRVTLTRNYRSHPSIVQVFSDLFYGSRVEASDDPDLFRFVPPFFNRKSKHPMRFHVCTTGDERVRMVEDKVSFENLEEARLVVDYVKRIYAAYPLGLEVQQTNGSIRPQVSAADIGVISPYRGQLHLIREELNDANLHGITVDSVNHFQGDERSIIIVSLVRSRSIGFLREDRRLNVAISRPKHMLIVIGDLNLLQNCAIYRRYARMLNQMGCLYDPDPLHTPEYWNAELQDPVVPYNPPPPVVAAAAPPHHPPPADGAGNNGP